MGSFTVAIFSILSLGLKRCITFGNYSISFYIKWPPKIYLNHKTCLWWIWQACLMVVMGNAWYFHNLIWLFPPVTKNISVLLKKWHYLHKIFSAFLHIKNNDFFPIKNWWLFHIKKTFMHKNDDFFFHIKYDDFSA